MPTITHTIKAEAINGRIHLEVQTPAPSEICIHCGLTRRFHEQPGNRCEQYTVLVKPLLDRRLELDGKIIRTEFVHPPIPIRNLDWAAWVDGHEETACGHGKTEADAINDLLADWGPWESNSVKEVSNGPKSESERTA